MSDRVILLVEDSLKDQMLIKRSLKKAGITNEIVVAQDGPEVLDILFEKDGGIAENIAMIMLDLKLPKLTGHQVLKKIRESKRSEMLPVVIMTSSDEEEDVVRCYKYGANSYVKKPVNFEEFSQAVRNVGLYWMLTNFSPNETTRQ